MWGLWLAKEPIIKKRDHAHETPFLKAVKLLKEKAMSKEKDHLTLKWGTLKSWSFVSKRALTKGAKELLERYLEIGMSLGAAQQRNTSEQKEIICKLIDAGNFTRVFINWEGKYVSKTEAKKYVMEY